MHPTRNSAALISNLGGGRVMPGVGRLTNIQRLMKRTLIIFAIFSVCPVTLAQTGSESPNVDVLESVYRYEIPRCFRDLSPNAYFLSFFKHDPSDALIERLASRGLRVKKHSQFSHFKDRQTGKWSVLLAVTDVEANGARRFTVRTSCIAGWLNGCSYSHRVVLSNGRWVVTRTRLIGFS